jgi:hypothetical protein
MSQLGKLQVSNFDKSLDISKYCSYVITHILLPRDPDRGYNTEVALDAVVTYAIKLAELAYEAVTAYDAVYNEPDANGYILLISIL